MEIRLRTSKEWHKKLVWSCRRQDSLGLVYLGRPCCERGTWLAGSLWSWRGAWGLAKVNLTWGGWRSRRWMPGTPFFSSLSFSEWFQWMGWRWDTLMFLFCGCLLWCCCSPPLMYCLSGIVSLKAFACLPLSSLLVLCLYFAFPSAASLSGSRLVFCHLSRPPSPPCPLLQVSAKQEHLQSYLFLKMMLTLRKLGHPELTFWKLDKDKLQAGVTFANISSPGCLSATELPSV